jgi:hypothetical protein
MRRGFPRASEIATAMPIEKFLIFFNGLGWMAKDFSGDSGLLEAWREAFRTNWVRLFSIAAWNGAWRAGKYPGFGMDGSGRLAASLKYRLSFMA